MGYQIVYVTENISSYNMLKSSIFDQYLLTKLRRGTNNSHDIVTRVRKTPFATLISIFSNSVFKIFILAEIINVKEVCLLRFHLKTTEPNIAQEYNMV